MKEKTKKLNCPLCGEEISEDDVVCPSCGCLIEEPAYDIEVDLED